MTDMILQSAAASLSLIPGPTRAIGGTITYDGDYAIHSFTTVGTGSFTIETLGEDNTFDVLVVAGGGGAGQGGTIVSIGTYYGAGGGGGGVVYQTGRLIPTGTYSVIVGDGGINATFFQSASVGNGKNSSFNGLTAVGGGGGSSYGQYYEPSPDPRLYAGNGGSGGGTAGAFDDGSTVSCVSDGVLVAFTGSGVQSSQAGDSGTYGFGNRGSISSDCQQAGSAPTYTSLMKGGAGGGAGSAGNNTTGGTGKTVTIRGASETFAAGGNVGAFADGGTNTGDGGSSGTDGGFNDGVGGSGIVVIRYKYK